MANSSERVGWKHLTLFFLFFFIACAFPVCGTDWDVEYWQYWNWTNWQRGKYRFYTIGEARLDRDLSKFYHLRLSGNFAYSPFKFLDLEAHYTYIYTKNPGDLNFSNRNRLELEINPNYTFDNGTQIIWRNRYELIKRQHISKWRSVIRDRLMIVFPIKNCGCLNNLFIFDEVFYHFDTHMFTQNRIAPLGANFDLGRGNSIDLFLQIRNFHSGGAWHRSFVFATQIFY